MKSFTINQISELLGGKIIGNTTHKIIGPEELEKATENHISFIGSSKYLKAWAASKACVAIVNDDIDTDLKENTALIQVKNADLAMAQLLHFFEPESPSFTADIHPNANIDPSAKIGNNCKIGAGCFIGKNVSIQADALIYPNVTIFDDAIIGAGTIIWSGTVIRERSIIGKNCIIHSNVSIGADGFGYRPKEDGTGLIKIPQIGNVVIGDDVEIGANTCIDKGKFSATILGDGCKIDNLVQIGHNSVLGKYCIMAGNSGLAGSVTLGNGVIIGGSASIKDHVTLEDGVVVGAGSGVIGNVSAGKTVLGYPACDAKQKLKQWVALKKLGNS